MSASEQIKALAPLGKCPSGLVEPLLHSALRCESLSNAHLLLRRDRSSIATLPGCHALVAIGLFRYSTETPGLGFLEPGLARKATLTLSREEEQVSVKVVD